LLSGARLSNASRGSAAGRESGREAGKVSADFSPVQPARTAKSSEHFSNFTAPTGGRERARAEAQAVEAQERECARAASL